MTIGFATSKISVKKITSSKIKNPVTRTTTTESRATRKGATVLEEGSESIGNINNRTHSSLNNLHRSTGEKSYTLNSEKSNWKFKPEIPRTAVKNSEGNYTLGRGNEWNFNTKYNIPYTETGNKGQGLVSVPKYNAVNSGYISTADKGSIFYYRGDSASMKPEIVFEKGILPKGKHNDLFKHISGEKGNFVSTSSDFNIGDGFAGKNGYNYIIDTDRGIDTVKIFGEEHPYPEQKEFSIPNGIKNTEIKGVYQYKNNKIIKYIENPNYKKMTKTNILKGDYNEKFLEKRRKQYRNTRY